MEQVVIAGGSIAGVSAAKQLRRSGFRGRVLLLDAERSSPYRRPEVSKGLLDGRVSARDVRMELSKDLDVDHVTNARIVGLDVAERRLVANRARGVEEQFPYDGLVIATGANARPSPFGNPSGVHTLRNLNDAALLRRDIRTAKEVVIVGGGFIGMEVAGLLADMGRDVTVVEVAEAPLVQSLGSAFGRHMASLHEDRGVKFRCCDAVDSVMSTVSGRVAVSMASGLELAADLVLVAIGAKPTTDWLEGSGLDLTDGVMCDSTCAVPGFADIVSAGDVASWYNPLYERVMRVEHWTNAIEQGGFAAKRLLGTHAAEGFISAPYFWSDQVGGKIQSIGSPAGHDQVVILEREGPRLVIAYGRRGRLIAVAGFDAGSAIMRFRRAIMSRLSMAEIEGKASLGP